MNNVKGYAAQNKESGLAPFEFKRRDKRPDDVMIDILYTGVCHSDIHQVYDDWNAWNKTMYPLVPGHEIIGKVLETGSDVTRFKVGDIVGVGCMVDSCQHCLACTQNKEQYCENTAVFTYNSIDTKDNMPMYGGYSENIIVNEKFVLNIPSNLDIKSAAPLLCAGITTYSPLMHWGVKEGTSVAIIGIGGLGHMALKIAKALKAHVTMISRSPDKSTDMQKLGADAFVLSTDAKQMESVNNKFDLIINTIPYKHNINPYIPILKENGTMVIVGYLGDLEINTVPLIMGRKAITGSMIGGIKETQEMLEFCAKHNISPDIKLIDIKEINEAYNKMINREAKNYRFVIDMASLKNK